MKIVMIGGHHSSALPVIQKLREEEKDLTIHWFGHRHSLKGDRNDTLEYKEITGLGIEFIELVSGKVYKNLSFGNLFKILKALVFSFKKLVSIGPDIVVSFGGYLAVPVVIAAWVLGIKIVTHEQTLVSGYANRLIALFSDRVLVSWAQSKSMFPAEKVVFTGMPLRPSIFQDKGKFAVNPDLPTLLVMGGKTGSHKINGLIKNCLPELLSKYNLIHQVGDYSEFHDFEDMVKLHENLKRTVGKYFPVKFLLDDEIGSAYTKADVVVCRAGAHTTLELLALKKKSLLIPIPWVSHNEQFLNAKLVEESGMGLILEEKELSKDKFLSVIETIVSNSASLKLDVFKDYPKDAETRIANQIRLVLLSE